MRLKRILFGFIALFLVFSTLGGQWYWQHSFSVLEEQHNNWLNRFVETIDSKLDKYRHIPQLLSQDKELIDALLSPNNSAQIDVTNRYLQQANRIILASDTYLIDRYGNTIASSNWDLPHSFIGKNFAFRPYFQEAIKGGQSTYFALGSTSGQRGYYYAFPVVYAAEHIGVVVVKMDLSAIERNWQSETSIYVATDSHHVVFMSSQPDWLFHSLAPLSKDTLNDIRESRQYLNTDITSMGFRGNLTAESTLLSDPKGNVFTRDYLVTQRESGMPDLILRVLTPLSTLYIELFGFVSILALVFITLYLIVALVENRRYRHRQIEQLQAEAKQKLEFLVMERTAELHIEIDERVKTEKALRQAQDELIQAAKLAVLGQMSASISHELNNPLAAIRSFAENGQRFIEKDKIDRAKDNLTRIVSLTERMAKISQQLKSFARRSDGNELSHIKLAPVIFSTIELIQPQLKSHQVKLDCTIGNHDAQVYINPIQVEQVLINLLTNAIQAMDDTDLKQLNLSVEIGQTKASIHIDDSGPGLPADSVADLFEPFYTTKENGLGLGLSISQQIIRNLNGTIRVASSPLGGARFTVELPLSPNMVKD
ncbi:ATP-binding protein [Vibrio hangzhouensis]|uniref:sensor histidine kinase n=1 Tax=Vibrio hangzhouensis TaxID=462991 RepID=UPI001C94C87B|nr:ATP-binding protein [Vibrio hangzhouensis]MBY6197683.1 sensor histidine kinase [Vibrio hangzhouensis]